MLINPHRDTDRLLKTQHGGFRRYRYFWSISSELEVLASGLLGLPIKRRKGVHILFYTDRVLILSIIGIFLEPGCILGEDLELTHFFVTLGRHPGDSRRRIAIGRAVHGVHQLKKVCQRWEHQGASSCPLEISNCGELHYFGKHCCHRELKAGIYALGT